LYKNLKSTLIDKDEVPPAAGMIKFNATDPVDEAISEFITTDAVVNTNTSEHTVLSIVPSLPVYAVKALKNAAGEKRWSEILNTQLSKLPADVFNVFDKLIKMEEMKSIPIDIKYKDIIGDGAGWEYTPSTNGYTLHNKLKEITITEKYSNLRGVSPTT
jgi:hypothetical protein